MSGGKRWRIRVYHSAYGCETGCCGHVVEIDDGEVTHEAFDFDHPDKQDVEQWAREFAEETIRLSYPECLGSIDWGTLDMEGVCDSC